ncbi:acid phosphatase/Vanadium-dependent haloperoxidase [Linderina pennispora]|uniref:Acid phosphatase/Vanadium-dependent haloperoxidase n=1 Tax=Linderina pennispora TaxID=61395 RepID=A0A1Y1WHY4_9FUNG|nr:acid phosphatase/Vanadium-dependent haloperoxidase [Linderina pennispora]ORX73127.1 acid phosphatase/Vanadium-dependent haloperoxidase [Linderina pennispora]
MTSFFAWLANARLPASMVVSYIPDWIVTCSCTLIWLYLGIATPHYQYFSVTDKEISYPYVKPEDQTVTVPMLFFIATVVPAVIVVLYSLCLRRNLHDLHVGLLGLLLTISLTLMFTNGLKNVLGRPRPNLLARCQPRHPKDGGPLADPPQGLSSIDICEQPSIGVLNEGFRSFPSGHTSLSFAGMTYLSLYLAGKLHVFDNQGHSFKSFIVMFPILVAGMVGASRVADYWHHPTDVFAGAFVGLATALFSYHQYYPVLYFVHCDRPFDPRKAPSPILPVVDEEFHRRRMNAGEGHGYAMSPTTSSNNFAEDSQEALVRLESGRN